MIFSSRYSQVERESSRRRSNRKDQSTNKRRSDE